MHNIIRKTTQSGEHISGLEAGIYLVGCMQCNRLFIPVFEEEQSK
jgi:hypothetical protein